MFDVCSTSCQLCLRLLMRVPPLPRCYFGLRLQATASVAAGTRALSSPHPRQVLLEPHAHPSTHTSHTHPSTHTSHTHPSTHTFASHCPRPIDGLALVLGTSARCRVSGWGLRVWCGGVAAVARGASQVLPWWAKTTAALATRPPVCGQERPRCRSVGVEVANRVRCHLTLYSKG